MTANDLDKRVMDRLVNFDVSPLLGHFSLLASGQYLEVQNKIDNQHLYYQWLHELVAEVQPKQIVELGAAAGISTIMMVLAKPKECVMYSVDNDPTAWKWMKEDYGVKKILASDLNMSIWKDVDLSKTDVWFIDTLHEEKQLRKEIELYSPYWKKGAIVIFDDIRLPELWPVWDELQYDKCENSNPNHYSGFGFIIGGL